MSSSLDAVESVYRGILIAESFVFSFRQSPWQKNSTEWVTPKFDKKSQNTVVWLVMSRTMDPFTDQGVCPGKGQARFYDVLS
jgi:hypothetical protein